MLAFLRMETTHFGFSYFKYTHIHTSCPHTCKHARALTVYLKLYVEFTTFTNKVDRTKDINNFAGNKLKTQELSVMASSFSWWSF